MSSGPIVVTTAVDTTGICCYMKMDDGTIIAEYNPTTNAQVKAAQNKGDITVMQEMQPWYNSSNISCKCDTDSGLSAYAWTGKAALFHQFNKKLCYWIHEWANFKQAVTDNDRINIPDPIDSTMQCRPGTKLAVTGDSSAKVITLFYQDKGGYLCYRIARSLVWDEPERLHSAAFGTGIAAVSWDDNDEIQVFYQDDNFAIKDYYCSGDTWNKGVANFSDPKTLTDIDVVQWTGDKTGQTELRVYFQVGQSCITERCWSEGKDWYGAQNLYDTFVAQFNVIAFCRGNDNNPVISLWITSREDRVLLQRAYNRPNAWIPAVGYAIPRTFY